MELCRRHDRYNCYRCRNEGQLTENVSTNSLSDGVPSEDFEALMNENGPWDA